MTSSNSSQPRYPLGSALEFLEQLWALNHALHKLSGDMEVRLGVTARQRLIIRCLGKYPGLPAGQLASLLHVDPGTISAALQRLEKKGLIQRRSDPRDRRRSSLGLTPAGRAIDTSTPRTVEHAVAELLATSSASDVKATARILSRLTAQLHHELSEKEGPSVLGGGRGHVGND